MALINPMGVVCASTQPILKHMYDVTFSSPGGTFSGMNNLEDLRISGLKQTMGIINYTPFNSTWPIAGIKEPVRDAVCTFRFLDGTKGFDFWKAWFRRVYDPETDRVGLFPEYRGDGTINIYKAGSSKAQPSQWGTIRLKDCWPMSIGPDELDMSSDGEIFTYTVTLQALDTEMEIG
jgi:hypothetical protein